MVTKEQKLKKAIAKAKEELEPGAEYGGVFGVLQAQIDAIVAFLTSKK